MIGFRQSDSNCQYSLFGTLSDIVILEFSRNWRKLFWNSAHRRYTSQQMDMSYVSASARIFLYIENFPSTMRVYNWKIRYQVNVTLFSSRLSFRAVYVSSENASFNTEHVCWHLINGRFELSVWLPRLKRKTWENSSRSDCRRCYSNVH